MINEQTDENKTRRSKWGHVDADPTTQEISNILNLKKRILIIDITITIPNITIPTPPNPHQYHGNKITPSTCPSSRYRGIFLIRA